MLVKKARGIKYSEITPKKFYLRRREFITGSTALAACAFLNPRFSRVSDRLSSSGQQELQAGKQEPQELSIAKGGEYTVPGEKITAYDQATRYTNYYEFSTGKREVRELAKNFRTRPWTIAVEGLVKEPKIFDVDEIIHIFPLEERIYRWRCVEAWSMVIPWIGFPLAEFVKKCEPTSAARFIEFTTLLDRDQMPGLKSSILKWPYIEGLRMDESRHPLSLLAVGMYDEYLPPQNGAPIRLVVPWKYGFKSIKSVVKVRFTAKMPQSAWMKARPEEYGFYANVNPDVSHPRWSQATERRIGEEGKRKTLIFNGYKDEVGHLYAGMNLKKDY